ncbi:hypothetical protein BH23THE1_BH23THE1_25160 [soil metagenome]
MEDFNFSNKDVKYLADRLLNKLYIESKGDEWISIPIIPLYTKILEQTTEPQDDLLKKHVLQCLAGGGFIQIEHALEEIHITYEGKRYLNKVPHMW